MFAGRDMWRHRVVMKAYGLDHEDNRRDRMQSNCR